MSFTEAGWVLDHSPLSGTAFAVHVVLGELANAEHGFAIFARQEWLAHRARTTRSTVGRVLADMVTAGLLEPLSATTFAPNRYRFIMDSARYPLRVAPTPRTTKPRTQKGGVPPMPTPVVHPFAAREEDPSCGKSARVPCGKSAHITKDLELQVEAKSLATDKPSPKGTRGKSVEPKFSEAAHKLATDEWERRTIKPMAGKFAAFRSQIQRELDAGATPAQLAAVLPGMANFSANSFDFHLNGKGKRNGLRSVPLPISADRDAPEGLVET